jgi:hypothetical protein
VIRRRTLLLPIPRIRKLLPLVPWKSIDQLNVVNGMLLGSVSSLKSILGRKFSDPYLQGFSTSVQWSIVEHGGLPFIKLGYMKRDGTPADLVVRVDF